MKIFHGVINTGGICERLAAWQRAHGYAAEMITIARNPYRQAADRSLELRRHSYPMQILLRVLLFLYVLCTHRVLFFYSGQTILPRGIDLPFYRLMKKRTVMISTGSDIRLARLESSRNVPFRRYLADRNEMAKDWVKRRNMRWQGRWIDHIIVCRILADSARACVADWKLVTNLPVINALATGSLRPRYFEGKPVRIIHAPTNDRIKGTALIEAAMQAVIATRDDIVYTTVRGLSHEDLLARIRDGADIVIDQLILGDFGNVAVEAMALGKAVCGFLLPEILDDLPDLPIVNCDETSLQSCIKTLADNPERLLDLGRRGRKFVEAHFDQEELYRRITQLVTRVGGKR